MKKRKPVLRKCIACGKQSLKKDLIRIVKSKNGDISVDRTGKQNGRGAYICDDKSCFEISYKKNLFARSFQTNISSEVYKELSKNFDE